MRTLGNVLQVVGLVLVFGALSALGVEALVVGVGVVVLCAGVALEARSR
jgi:hypothetical protein